MKTRKHDWLSGVLLAVGLVLSGAFLFHGLGGRIVDLEPQAVAAAASAMDAQQLAKPIEQIQVGDRVAAERPEIDRSDSDVFVLQRPQWDVDEIDPERWRRIELTVVKGSNHRFDIVLLRPMEWLKETAAQVGGSIHLYLPEQGLDGSATVRAIGPCPPIRSGTGEVVTATITHIRSGVLELKLAGIDGPLGVTGNHPVYSVDRRAFVPAADLQPGETLQLLNGVTQVESIHPLPGNHRVYNLEVHARHVYHVTSAGVLVHNASPHVNFETLKPDILPGYEGQFTKPAGYFEPAIPINSGNYPSMDYTIDETIQMTRGMDGGQQLPLDRMTDPTDLGF